MVFEIRCSVTIPCIRSVTLINDDKITPMNIISWYFITDIRWTGEGTSSKISNQNVLII